MVMVMLFGALLEWLNLLFTLKYNAGRLSTARPQKLSCERCKFPPLRVQIELEFFLYKLQSNENCNANRLCHKHAIICHFENGDIPTPTTSARHEYTNALNIEH